MSNQNKPGRYVQLEKKNDVVRKGLVYNDADLINGKVPVHIVNSEWEQTGEKVLSDINKLIVVGYKN